MHKDKSVILSEYGGMQAVYCETILEGSFGAKYNYTSLYKVTND